MKQKRARLIYNPTSGQEIMKKNVAEVLDILEGAGFEASAFKQHQMRTQQKMKPHVRPKQALT